MYNLIPHYLNFISFGCGLIIYHSGKYNKESVEYHLRRVNPGFVGDFSSIYGMSLTSVILYLLKVDTLPNLKP
jgi:hypothetical protein